MQRNKTTNTLLFVFALTIISLFIVLPSKIGNFTIPRPNLKIGSINLSAPIELKQGLDIKGGVQVTLLANMDQIAPSDRKTALDSLQNNIKRRLDPYGVSEASVKTSIQNESYRLIVELPGITNSEEALARIGKTAKLEFALPQFQAGKTASDPAEFIGFKQTGLTGEDLKSAQVSFDSQTGEPVVSLVFKDKGKEKFAQITKENLQKPVSILLDGEEISSPVVQTEILNGQAQITGSFTTDEAKSLSVNLNAGALPVPVSVISQKNISATLGSDSIEKSITAGGIGLAMVIVFMVGNYGRMGIIASIGLVLYGLFTLALYKIIPVVLTLPGIAGFLLSVGMAVDSNILIFERYKEEIRQNKNPIQSLELAFGRAWDSIKDANTATIITGLILLNPLDWSFLNTSGAVKGFALTLIIGIFISLFTGIVVTRNLLRLFYHNKPKSLQITKPKNTTT